MYSNGLNSDPGMARSVSGVPSTVKGTRRSFQTAPQKLRPAGYECLETSHKRDPGTAFHEMLTYARVAPRASLPGCTSCTPTEVLPGNPAPYPADCQLSVPPLLSTARLLGSSVSREVSYGGGGKYRVTSR